MIGDQGDVDAFVDQAVVHAGNEVIERRIVERIGEVLIEVAVRGVAVELHRLGAGLVRLDDHARRIVVRPSRVVRHRLQQLAGSATEQPGDALVIRRRIGVGQQLLGRLDLGDVAVAVEVGRVGHHDVVGLRRVGQVGGRLIHRRQA